MQNRVIPGEPIVLESFPAGGRYGVFFEDDGETGYLYGLDVSRTEQPIVDALHIYDVTELVPGTAITVSIEWDSASNTAALYVNGAAQAVFDFADGQARCRTGYPPANGKFCSTHDWDDEIIHRLHPLRRS